MNTGILSENPNDSLAGSLKIPPVIRTVRDWNPYLPAGELQRSNMTDFMDCVTFSAIHCIETQINYDIAKGLYKQEALDYFQSAGYMENGTFRASVRYNAVMNGTTPQGQYMSVAGKGLSNYPGCDGHGLLPNSDMPMLPNSTWVQYYATPTAAQIAKAKEIYKYLDIRYTWVPLENLDEYILNSPVQIATSVCPVWESDPIVKKCGGPMEHLTMMYGRDSSGNIQDFDHYVPFKKTLSSDYHVFSSMQYTVTPALPPTLWTKLLALIKNKQI